jgi:ABC-2 type transport system ATP-binding protein
LAIACRGLTRAFGPRRALDGLDLEVEEGAVFGFLGPNGAGKTTTVRLLLGLLAPSAGSVRVFGLDPVAQGERVRAATGVLLDQVGLYDRLTAWQNLALAARIAKLPAPAARIEAALRRVQLWERRQDHVSGFSRGMRQKLGIARALLAGPSLLVLDEPTASLDPENIKMVRDLLLGLAREGGRTIFLCTHHLDEAQRICSQVAILQRGRLVASGPPGALGGDGPAVRVRVRCARPEVARAAALDLAGAVALGPPESDGAFRLQLPGEAEVERLVEALVRAGAGVREVVPERRSLEEVYLRLVAEAEPGDAGGTGR